MKRNIAVVVVGLVVVASAGVAVGQATGAVGGAVEEGVRAMPEGGVGKDFVFRRGGLLNSREELDFVKGKIAAGEEPWVGWYREMKGSGMGRLDYKSRAKAVVRARGGDAEEMKDDAAAAYTQALLWYFSGEEGHAKKAAEILNSWSGVLVEITSEDRQKELVAGWAGSVFPLAGEILRSSYPGWGVEEQKRFSGMLEKVFVPALMGGNATFNGNWELTMANGLVAIGAFNGDVEAFNRGVWFWRKRVPAYVYLGKDGATPVRPVAWGDGGGEVPEGLRGEEGIRRYWFGPVGYFDGLTQETMRDFGHHTQSGVGSAVNVAEIAWHQGLDLYGEEEGRLVAAMEWQAARMLGKAAAVEFFPKGYKAAGALPTWEVGFNHFHNRRGIAMPNTEELIRTKIRLMGFRVMLNSVWESMTHGGREQG